MCEEGRCWLQQTILACDISVFLDYASLYCESKVKTSITARASSQGQLLAAIPEEAPPATGMRLYQQIDGGVRHA